MDQEHLSPNKQKLYSAIAIAAFVAVFIFIAIAAGKPLLRFASDPELFRAWIDARGVWGALAFIGIMTLQVIVAIIPGEAFEIGAGYAFGVWEGTLLCQISIAIGTTVIFLFVRRFGMRALEVFFPLEKINSMRYLRDSKKLYLLASLVFFIPGTPKDLITYFLGLTKIRLLPLVLISTFMRLPSIVTSTLSGDALGEERYIMAAIVFAAMLVISGIGLLIYRRISKTERSPRRTPERG